MTQTTNRRHLEFDPQRALPMSTYRSESFYEAELEHIWRGDWIYVGPASKVENPGDYFNTVVGGQPIIVLRNQKGDFTALSNLCAHRGTLLVEGQGNAKRFQCPYHAWTFKDDGALMSAPFSPRGEIDKGAHCLDQYRCESWNGLLFVSQNPDVAPLTQRFAHIEAHIAPLNLGVLHHWVSQNTQEIWEANWKLVIANAMESYHLFKVHPETLEPYTPTADAYYIAGSPEATVTGGKQKEAEDYVLLSLPPNFVGVFYGDSFMYQVVEPLSPSKSRVITGGAFKQKDPADDGRIGGLISKATASVTRHALPDFLPEDKEICERAQRGASGEFKPGQLLEAEKIVQDFHQYLRDRLVNRVEPS